jgi:hypothetical protein
VVPAAEIDIAAVDESPSEIESVQFLGADRESSSGDWSKDK